MINGARLLLVLSLFCLASTLKLAEQKKGAVRSNARRGHRVKLLRHSKGLANETGAVDGDDAGAESQADANADTTDTMATEGADVDDTTTEVADVDGSSQDDVLVVSAGKDVAQLHMVLYNLPPGPFVRVDKVDPGFWADKAGIEAGSEIVTINGKVAKDLTMKEFIALLKARPVKMTIKPPQEVASLGGPAPAAAAGVMQHSIAVNAVGPAPAPKVPAPVEAKAEAKTNQAKVDNVAPGKSANVAAQKNATANASKAAAASKAAKIPDLPLPPGMPKNADKLARAAYAAAVAAGQAAGARAGQVTAKQLVKELKAQLGIATPGKQPLVPPWAAAPVQPVAPAKKITAIVTIKHLNFTKVMANAVVKNKIIADVKAVFLAKLNANKKGYIAADLAVTLSQGSVKANVVITPKAGNEAAAASIVTAQQASIATAILAKVKLIAGVKEMLETGEKLTDLKAQSITKSTTQAPQVPPVVPPIAPAPAPFAWTPLAPTFKATNDISQQPNVGIAPPVPPSPLDALKAAMAIRAGATAGQAPLLPPDVMDRVADMVRGRLGGFQPPPIGGAPCPPGAPAAAPFAAPPAAAPAAPVYTGPVLEKVEISMTIKNMSFTALSASPSMMAEFEQSVKQSMAESCGPNVKASDVEVRLKAGSVVVESKIAPPPGMKASDMDKQLAKGSNAIGARVVARVAVLPGIKSIALGKLSATGIGVKVVQEILPTTTVLYTTTPAPIRRLAKPPKCGAAPAKMTKGEVAMALAPFRPPGASHKAVVTKDGGKAWPLEDGGWAFQYPDMALRMQADGSTRIVWEKPAYSVEYDESGISYHVGQSVVHRDTNGDVTYQEPTGTMHQEGSTLVYHWCNPNVIVYQTPAGFVYYDDLGMTYRSFGQEVTHYTWSGEVLYQGAGGVTSQRPDGSVTHWTDAGAIFRHSDGSVTYTPVGERTSQTLSVGELGPDPFPGAALTTADVMAMSVPAAAPSPAKPALVIPPQ